MAACVTMRSSRPSSKILSGSARPKRWYWSDQSETKYSTREERSAKNNKRKSMKLVRRRELRSGLSKKNVVSSKKQNKKNGSKNSLLDSSRTHLSNKLTRASNSYISVLKTARSKMIRKKSKKQR